MKRRAQTLITWSLIGCLIPYLTGCSDLAENTITGHLWEGAGESHCLGRASQPNLSLYRTADRRDILVIYDETRDESGIVRRRAYLLNANKGRIEAGQVPRFIRVRHMDRLQTIPVESCASPEGDEGVSATMKAFLLADARHFTIICDDKEVGSFYLPAYENRGGRAWRVAVTPLAVSGDVAVYGAIAVAVVSLYALTHSGDDDDDGSFVPHHHEEHQKDKDKDKKDQEKREKPD